MNHEPAAMTAGELIAWLSTLPSNMPVVALYDSGCAGGNVTKAETGPGPDDDRESAVLTIE